ncbi:MAG: hypothetical protein ACYC8T_17800 [Myxococcaceae bacterium]
MFIRRKSAPWLWAPVFAAMVFTVAAYAALRTPERRSQAAVPARGIVGVDKDALPPASPSFAMPGVGLAPADLLGKQAEFLREAAQKEATEWQGLAEADREQRRAALKLSMLGEHLR